MATCAILGQLLQADGSALVTATVEARVANPVFSGTSLVIPALTDTTTDSSGNFTLTVQQSVSVIFTVYYPPVGTEPQRNITYSGTIPATTTASFSAVIVQEV